MQAGEASASRRTAAISLGRGDHRLRDDPDRDGRRLVEAACRSWRACSATRSQHGLAVQMLAAGDEPASSQGRRVPAVARSRVLPAHFTVPVEQPGHVVPLQQQVDADAGDHRDRDAAWSIPQSVPPRLVSAAGRLEDHGQRERRRLAHQTTRPEELVPGGDEREQRHRHDRRHHVRQEDLGQDLPRAATVDAPPPPPAPAARPRSCCA